MYPPHWIVLAVPLALLPWRIAERCWDTINVLALAGVYFVSLRLLLRERSSALTPWVCGLIAISFFNGAVRWCLWECQLTAVSLLGVAGAFWAWQERRPNWLVVFVFLATLKPQVSLLPLMFLLFNGGHVGVLRGVAVAFAVSLAALVATNSTLFFTQLLHSYHLHMAIEYNDPSNFLSISALFAGFDPDAKLAFISPLLGITIIYVLSRLRPTTSDLAGRQTGQLWPLALTLALNAAFVPMHGYDLIVYIPLVLLAYEIQPRWLACLIVVLAISASRMLKLAEWLDWKPMTPILVLSIALITLLAWWQARRAVLLQPQAVSEGAS
jgi:hypothetical protein